MVDLGQKKANIVCLFLCAKSSGWRAVMSIFFIKIVLRAVSLFSKHCLPFFMRQIFGVASKNEYPFIKMVLRAVFPFPNIVCLFLCVKSSGGRAVMSIFFIKIVLRAVCLFSQTLFAFLCAKSLEWRAAKNTSSCLFYYIK